MAFDPITAISNIVSTVIDRVVPDKAAAQKAKDALASDETKNEFSLALGQIQVNMEEAKNSNIFVSGWRPFVGWTCGAALCYAAIVEPVFRFTAQVGFKYVGAFPVIDTMLTLQVLLGLLGLGGLRTFEKTRK